MLTAPAPPPATISRDWGQAVLSPFPFPDNLAIAEGDKAEGNQAARELLLSGKALHISGCSWPERLDQPRRDRDTKGRGWAKPCLLFPGELSKFQ